MWNAPLESFRAAFLGEKWGRELWSQTERECKRIKTRSFRQDLHGITSWKLSMQITEWDIEIIVSFAFVGMFERVYVDGNLVQSNL